MRARRAVAFGLKRIGRKRGSRAATRRLWDAGGNPAEADLLQSPNFVVNRLIKFNKRLVDLERSLAGFAPLTEIHVLKTSFVR
jgi:hypothetical protein